MDNRQLFSVKKTTNLTDDKLAELISLTTDAFSNDPSFGYILDSIESIQQFIGVCLKYYHRSGQMYVCVNESGELCGVSCWVENHGENMNSHTMKKYGILTEFKQLIRSIPLRSIYRVFKLAYLTDKQHIKQPHSYLVMIASFQKGAGTALIEDYTVSHPSDVLYLENSNIKANTHFYQKCGFQAKAEIRCGSLRVSTMLR